MRILPHRGSFSPVNVSNRHPIRWSVLAVALFVASAAAQDRSSRTLDIYVVDVEGGNATLFVSPSRQSLLIDTGNGGPAAVRDADRIMAASPKGAGREEGSVLGKIGNIFDGD